MELKRITFNNFDLTRYIFIDNFRKNMYNNSNIVVEIDFTILGDVQTKIDMLNRILHTNEPKFLTYSKLPGRQLLCQLDGEIEPEEFKDTVRGTMSFISEDNYWHSVRGLKEYDLKSDNIFTVDNEGTAPTKPVFELDFSDESGYLAVTAPNGYMLLGDKEELDKVALPEQEILMQEEMDHQSMVDDPADWITVNSDSHANGLWVPDYNKLSIGTGNIAHDEFGMVLNKSNNPKTGYYWNTMGYQRLFNESAVTGSNEYKNFKVESRISFYDASGKTNNTGMFLIIIQDKDNRPIMTTSIYNVATSTNEVTATTKLNSKIGDKYSSKIFEDFTFHNGFNGFVRMTRENDRFSWVFDSGRDQSFSYYANITSAPSAQVKKDSIVYIKDTAQYGYHHNGTRYSIAGFTRGRAHKATESRTFQGKTQYLINYDGYAVYWMFVDDLTVSRDAVTTTRQKITIGESRIREFGVTDTGLKDMDASKILVLGGTWDSTNAFDHASINSIYAWGLNGTGNWHEIKNTFQPGDKITVNHQTGEIKQNGLPYQGKFQNSGWFDIDHGPSDLVVDHSDWSVGVEGKIYFEERYR